MTVCSAQQFSTEFLSSADATLWIDPTPDILFECPNPSFVPLLHTPYQSSLLRIKEHKSCAIRSASSCVVGFSTVSPDISERPRRRQDMA